MNDNKNTILAILLSVIVLVAWQYFVGIPQMEKQREAAQRTQQQTPAQPAPAPGQPAATPGAAPVPGQPPRPGTVAQPAPGAPTTVTMITTREAALAASPRIAVETPRMRGSISLRGARIDDVSLTQYRETVDPKSPNIVLLSPSGSPHPFYAEFGWVGAPGATSKLPGPDTLWTAATPGPLAPDRPIKLSWDNGEGLVFTRTIAVDRDYMFTVSDEVENKAANPVTLFNYGLVSRHGTPVTLGYYILHEGLVGVLGDGKLHEIVYTDIEKKTPADRQIRGRLARHHRQILGGDADPEPEDQSAGALLLHRARKPEDLPGRLPRRSGDRRAGRETFGAESPVRRRQGTRHHRSL